jgi:hypothetical protein
VLAFFRERLGLFTVQLEESLDCHGVATPEGVRLAPSAVGQPREASVLAHELFHLWMRRAVEPHHWRGLSCLRPLFAPPEATVEELATDLLARALCERASIPFHPTYLTSSLPVELLEERLRAGRLAAEAALRAPLGEAPLLAARDALQALSGFELSALALAEAGSAPVVRWPERLWSEVAELHRSAGLFLRELAAPQLLRSLARFLAVHRWNDRRRGPLWRGDLALELPGRLLQQRARARSNQLREAVVEQLADFAQKVVVSLP